MSMQNGILRVIVFMAALIGSQAARAASTATLSLGSPQFTGSVVSFDVTLLVTLDPASERLIDFVLDASPSDPQLTGGGTFSAFSFTPASPPLGDWLQVGFFGDPGFESSVELLAFDALNDGLPAGQHLLGSLSVDLALAGLAPGTPTFIAINGPGAAAAFEDIQTGASQPGGVEYSIAQITFITIPEPASALLALAAATALVARRRITG